MAGWDAETLVRQLSQLGRDLDAEIKVLAELEDLSVEEEGLYRQLKEEHEDRVAEEFLRAEGNLDTRKSIARLKAVPARLIAEDQWKAWQKVRRKVLVQNASLNAIRERIGIGRSLLARERTLAGLAGIGET